MIELYPSPEEVIDTLEAEIERLQKQVEARDEVIDRILNRACKMVRMDNGWVQDVIDGLRAQQEQGE